MARLGPLVVVLASVSPEAADVHAVGEASLHNAWVTACLGLGYALPDPYVPDGLWLHVYATEQPTPLEVVWDDVSTAEGRDEVAHPNASDPKGADHD